MNVRIKFAKQGVMKFVGHLDMMRYFQKANRRACIDIKYSEGYSPHQVMSFAAPLGVGTTSRGEYFDISVNSSCSSKEMIKRLNGAMAEGVEILSWRKLPDDAKNCMSIVAGADYNVYFEEKIFISEDGERRDFEKLLDEFFSQSEINVLKKTKKSEKIVNIKPMIYELRYMGDGVVFMKVAHGSVANLKPELVFTALCDFADVRMSDCNIMYERLEIYADVGDGTERKLVSLESFGEEIE